jgi:hypothetical protein
MYFFTPSQPFVLLWDTNCHNSLQDLELTQKIHTGGLNQPDLDLEPRFEPNYCSVLLTCLRYANFKIKFIFLLQAG